MVNGPSQAAIGRALDLSGAMITRYKKDGMPTHSIEAAAEWYKNKKNVAARKNKTPLEFPARPEPQDSFAGMGIGTVFEPGAIDHPPTAPDESFDRARIREKIALANMAEMEEARIKGLHVEKLRVDLGVFEVVRSFRDGVTNSSRRLAAEVATLTTPGECEVVIYKELRHLLTSLIHQLSTKIATPVVPVDDVTAHE